MADARRMGKMELFAHFAEKFDMKRTAVRDLFEELLRLTREGAEAFRRVRASRYVQAGGAAAQGP